MNIVSIIAKLDRIKILVLSLSVTSVVLATLSLGYITDYLLQRDAHSVSMHWAEDIEASLDNFDLIFSQNPKRTNVMEVLRQLSTVGRVYRYDITDIHDRTIFDTSTYKPAKQKPIITPSASKRNLSPNHHNKSTQDVASAHHDSPQHSVILKTGDGHTHPELYAYVVHPVTKDGHQLGTLKLYIDQTDTHALMSAIVFAFMAVLACMFIFTCGLPTFLYIRSKAKEMLALNEFTEQQKHLDTALSIMYTGFCMFDDDQNVVICNERYATMYNMSPEQVKPGTTLNEIVENRVKSGCHVGSDMDEYRSIVNNLDSIPLSVPRTYQLKDGRYVEITDFKMESGGWFTIHEEITERVVAKLELVHRNERLDVALETISQGLCMFDADRKIMVSNDQFAEIYNIPPELISPGTSQQKILELRIERGTYAGSSPEEYLQGRKIKLGSEHRHTDAKIHHLNDGRYIEIRDHLMANGGWLSTHEDVTERHIFEKKIKHLANYDALTGLPNRSQIQGILEGAIYQACENKTKVALLYIDLDCFKEVNDTLGHIVGDQVLKNVGKQLAGFQSETISMGRLSGDEFLMVVKGEEDTVFLQQLGDRICSILAIPFHVEQDLIEISASIGISVGPTESGTVGTLIQHSDLALFHAKADGGNSYRFFEEKMYSDAQKRQRMAADLRSAIRNDELFLHYQPQVDLGTQKINGYEALVRWQHPELGMVSPVQFIELAEETGQINEIGEWVLRTACEYAVSWPNEEKISVNLSPVQFKRQDIVAMVKNVLLETGLEPERLELEVTESALIQNTDSVTATLKVLIDNGISIALDDFGTGFSSLSYLMTIPFTKIKIDKSFVDKICTDSEVAAIVSMITQLGRSLDRVVTAEGIETSGQDKLLRAAGCHQGQGYLYGKPLPQILEIDQSETPALRQVQGR